MTTRKQFLIGAGSVVGTTLFAPFVARAARPTVIRFGIDLPADHPMSIHAAAAAADIKRESNGEVELRVFPNNQIGNDTHMFSSVRSGAIQMMGLGSNILANLVSSAGISDLGFAFKDPATAYAAMDGAVGDLVRTDIAAQGLEPLPVMWSDSFFQISTSTKPIETPEDLKNFKIRVPESAMSISLFKGLGAAPVTLNLSELYTALQTHVMDGAELPLATIETGTYYQVQKYCSLTNHFWLGYWMLANGPFWKKLPAAHRKVIADAFNAQGMKERTAIADFNKSLQTKLTAQGVKFNTTNPAQFRAMLMKNGFYREWKKKFGPQLWSTLEKYTGTLA
ncbi:MAG TPA: TRAP transporter substrate-binding protein [Acidiphilium sp.]